MKTQTLLVRRGIPGNSSHGTSNTVVTHDYDSLAQAKREPETTEVIPRTQVASRYNYDPTRVVYYGHRYYSPSLGRFINRDPIEEQGGINLYSFVGNDPVNRWDLLGMVANTHTNVVMADDDEWDRAINDKGRAWSAGSVGSSFWGGAALKGATEQAGIDHQERLDDRNTQTTDLIGLLGNLAASLSGDVPKGNVIIGDPILSELQPGEVPAPSEQSTGNTHEVRDMRGVLSPVAEFYARQSESRETVDQALQRGFSEKSGALNAYAKVGEVIAWTGVPGGSSIEIAEGAVGLIGGGITLTRQGIIMARAAGQNFKFRTGLQIAQVASDYSNPASMGYQTLVVRGTSEVGKAAEAAARAAKIAAEANRLASSPSGPLIP